MEHGERIVDVLPGLVWTARPDGRTDFVNERWCEYTGVSAAEARSGEWVTGVHVDDLPGVLERWESGSSG